ncbi:hypothetical protein EJB05_04880 [Eragrostis curvula]|uniref:phosphoribosylformylglycinamidine synthase n=1 Tax=Eragrostis curvula TaxID=38414 RepID=A0A5J9WBL6_9POAL|nr:hypothetical protein EJB05_04880 [Eragrostis curvula]
MTCSSGPLLVPCGAIEEEAARSAIGEEATWAHQNSQWRGTGFDIPLVEKSVTAMEVGFIHFYRKPFLQQTETTALLRKSRTKVSANIVDIMTEQCFNIQLDEPLTPEKLKTLHWLLAETFEPHNLQTKSFLEDEVSISSYSVIVEVGPRIAFPTAFSTNAVTICKSVSVVEVIRLERSRRYLLCLEPGSDPLDEKQLSDFVALVHDQMTECVYPNKLTSFHSNVVPKHVSVVPVIGSEKEALEERILKMGPFISDYIKCNQTTVEPFITKSNSEHSRNDFFNGKLVVDGETMPKPLFQLMKSSMKAKDISSAIKGFPVNHLHPMIPGSASPLYISTRELDILFTAETYNFPPAMEPYLGSEKGVSGRIRDTHATGKGSFIAASTAGYCVCNLRIDDSYVPWEDPSFPYQLNLASLLQILVDASDGTSDYGGTFGEPLIQGFTRNFGMILNGERCEWLKPIMFSGAIGQIDHAHVSNGDPKIGMLVVKIGGPPYRFGTGGAAASSMINEQNDAEVVFSALQSGDAEMAHKLYRVVRTCAEMGDNNPIISFLDQGAGDSCNVLKETMYTQGSETDIRSIVFGDDTLSVLEIWGAEYHEQDVLLVKPESRTLLESLCERERVPMTVIGTINGSGKIILTDSAAVEHAKLYGIAATTPVEELELEKVLEDIPQKTFDIKRTLKVTEPLIIAPDVTLMDALNRILRLPSVCSKRFLTTKVDRSVTGLVAQQQTVGPLQLPLADVAVISQSYTDLTGGACSIGEQPIKGLLNPKAMARLALGEALTNLVWAKVTSFSDVKASANWMYAGKLDGHCADMNDAAVALAHCMSELGISIEWGRRSLSMSAQCDGEVVKAPINLVISTYASCPDITLTVTPDLKLGEDGVLLHIDMANGKRRLGGSALAQAFDQIGNECPDIDDVSYLKKVFETIQELLIQRLISAGHDISDGGLIVCVLEMAFAGNFGIKLDIDLEDTSEVLESLFAEELGLVIEVRSKNLSFVKHKLEARGISTHVIGEVTTSPEIEVVVDGKLHLKEKTSELRDVWEETSFKLEELQRLKSCVKLEKDGLRNRTSPSWYLSFSPKFTDEKLLVASLKPKVAVIREEGSNGDREMAAAFYAAGFEPWDVTMSDLLAGKSSLVEFRGAAFVGGSSYADVLDSAKGWAASIRFNQLLRDQFLHFYNRSDTFSLGVCNGCQLMALLGWVPGSDVGGSLGKGGDMSQPRFILNESGRFECRFISVSIKNSPAIMFKGMEGSTLGIWSAHAKGRAFFPDESVLANVVKSNLAPVLYCDDTNNITEIYPFNPSGSPLGIAALCSPDGRHLAMMPHPERSFMMWQYPWYPKEWQVKKSDPSPWLRMFQNAREWCS